VTSENRKWWAARMAYAFRKLQISEPEIDCAIQGLKFLKKNHKILHDLSVFKDYDVEEYSSSMDESDSSIQDFLSSDAVSESDKRDITLQLLELSQRPKSAPEPKPKPSKVGNVYIMSDARNGLHKIGFSINPTKREKTLQSEVPSVSLIFSVKATLDYEESLHLQYESKRVRGEWFNLSSEDLESLKTEMKLNEL